MDNQAANVAADTQLKEEKPLENSDKKTNGKSFRLVAIIAILFACIGTGFGVYGMIDASNAKSELAEKDKKISALNSSIDTLNAKIEELENEKTADDKDEKEEETEYIEIEEFGIKVKKSKDLPDMVAYATGENHFVVKISPNAGEEATESVSFMKVPTCDDEELALGYSQKIDIKGTCFIMGEIIPYGVYDEYPLNGFLKHVLNKDTFSAL